MPKNVAPAAHNTSMENKQPRVREKPGQADEKFGTRFGSKEITESGDEVSAQLLDSAAAISDSYAYEANVAQANAAAAAYYDTDVELLTDSEYDRLLADIEAFEVEHPNEKIEHELFTAVAAGTSAGGDVEHDVPMLSLDKANTIAEVRAFVSKAESAGGTVRLEPKLDGMAVNVTYVDGKIERVTTRGDGKSGEDITDRILAINVSGLPRDVAYDGTVGVRGELLMSADDFELSNKNRVAAGKPAFANPRNATAGSVRASSREYTVALTFISYGMTGDQDSTETIAQDTHLAAQGFLPASQISVDLNAGSDVISEIEAFGVDRKTDAFPYPTDGIVVKVVEPDVREAMGETSRAPRWAVAYKYEADSAVTTLLGIDMAVGRTGAISFTANVEPVLVDGSTIARATLHNFDFIHKNDLRIGDKVEIFKANDIIPRIVRSFPEFRGEDSEPYDPPRVCPISGEPLDTESSVIWRSTSPEASLGSLLTYATSRDVFDIDGFGTELADALALSDTVNDMGDVFLMTEAELAAVTLDNGQLFGAVRAKKVYDGIQNAKGAGLARAITSLGIRKSGRTFGRRLAARFGSIDAILAAPIGDFYTVEGVGDERANLFYQGFTTKRPIIEKMRAAGVVLANPVVEETTSGGGGKPLAGMTVVVTGAMTGPLKGIARNAMNELIEANGGKSSGSVSKSTSLLVCGETGSSKWVKANELGVTIVTPDEFAGMVGM